ncbi:GGDEF domain-containing protein [uncultured Tateyamaria sp.]|uniref:GGDEF domain-containing protein n=1 Tax=uncultured Tateyamaria sp. TaxID=455651 RepID=UPI00262AE258|nr:GGDEF domain-containing protein [uncultured Tateyamaria sp.]
MKIESKWDVVLFSLVVTVTSMVCAVTLNYLIFPAEYLSRTVPGTMVIVTLVTIPTCLFVGSKIRENVHLSQELRRLVERDRLTDVATRDFFFNRMAKVPDAYGISLMVDIDFFKRVNDTYGHLTGDRVITHVASLLRGAVRPGDIVCRFGGEEFVVFLADADHTGGAAMAERLRALVAESPIDEAGTTLSVTVSIGGSLKEATDHIETAIQRADDALYRAKNGGRNQVHMHPIGNPRPVAVGETS